jgi:hypothetical protein
MQNPCNDAANNVVCGFCHNTYTDKYYHFFHCRDYPSGGCANNGGVRLPVASSEYKEHIAEVHESAAPAEPLPPPCPKAASPNQPDAPVVASPAITENEHYLEEKEYQVAHATSNAKETPDQLIERFLAIHLSGRQLQTLLNFFSPGHCWKPSSSSAKSILIAARDAKYGVGFQHIDISDEVGCPGEELVVSVRIDLVQHCNDTVTLKAEYLKDEYGQRLVNEFWTADRWLELQV